MPSSLFKQLQSFNTQQISENPSLLLSTASCITSGTASPWYQMDKFKDFFFGKASQMTNWTPSVFPLLRRTFPLLHLPEDVRYLIYRKVLLDYYLIGSKFDRETEVWRIDKDYPDSSYSWNRKNKKQSDKNILALLRVNRQIYGELHPLVYKRCVFRIFWDYPLHKVSPNMIRKVSPRLHDSIRVLYLSVNDISNLWCGRSDCSIFNAEHAVHSHWTVSSAALPNLTTIIYHDPLPSRDGDDLDSECREALDLTERTFGKRDVEVLFETEPPQPGEPTAFYQIEGNLVVARQTAGGEYEKLRIPVEMVEYLEMRWSGREPAITPETARARWEERRRKKRE